ncbi:MAG: hypothetical protein HZB86_12285 [Deltaproteobacteria bacterium]|nr:hypothetical protein [Deltaproteobacteria bacterium]
MKRIQFVLVVVLAAAAVSGGMRVAAVAGSAEKEGTVYSGSFICPDLAHTELFRAKGLEYVHTMAFAEALLTVAGGRSTFAPPPVPQEWQAAASNWTVHLATHEAGLAPQWLMGTFWPRFSSEENACDPALLHKASLEYRAQPGNGEAAVLFPYYPGMAAHDLEEMIVPLSGRLDRVSSRIATAEQVGAKECVPGKVARAKELLETARRATAEYHYDGVVIEPFFARAESAAEELIEERRMAAAFGFSCYSKN